MDAVRKRQVLLIGGGAGIWSFIEITDAAAVWLGRLLAGEFVVGLACGVPRYRRRRAGRSRTFGWRPGSCE